MSQSAEFESRAQELASAHRAYRTPRYRSLLLHWLGRWLRRPRRPAAAPLPTVTPGRVAISFAGHATTLIRYASRNIVCDPMLGKWVKGVKRAVMPGLTPADLHDVQLILISHGHADHLHRPTLAKLPKSATVVLPPRTAHLVSDLGFARVVELSPGKSLQDHGVDIATAPVKHDGEVPGLSYVLRGDGPSVYFCGDSGYFPGFAAIGRRYRPDIAILPIGGYLPLSFRERHMSPLDALYALEDLGARIMIPIHHGAFALSYERLHEPSRWLAELVRERGLEDFVVELEPGESRVFVPPRTEHADDRSPAPGSATPGPDTPPSKRDALAQPWPIHVPEARPETGPYHDDGASPHDAHPLPALRAFTRMQQRPWLVPALAEQTEDMDIVIDVDLDGLGEPVAALA